jgi:hypothetical protein
MYTVIKIHNDETEVIDAFENRDDAERLLIEVISETVSNFNDYDTIHLDYIAQEGYDNYGAGTIYIDEDGFAPYGANI